MFVALKSSTASEKRRSPVLLTTSKQVPTRSKKEASPDLTTSEIEAGDRRLCD